MYGIRRSPWIEPLSKAKEKTFSPLMQLHELQFNPSISAPAAAVFHLRQSLSAEALTRPLNPPLAFNPAFYHPRILS